MNFKPTPVNAPLTTRPVALDHAAANLCRVFDRCHLVAVPRGAQPEAVPAPQVDEANSSRYLQRLTTQSVAVKLGGVSGLLAIKLSDRAELAAFLDRNPATRETLVTAHAAGLVVWLRAITTYRASLDLAGVRLLMSGNIMVHDRTALHCRDEFLNLAEIKVIDLYSLDYGADPDGQVAAWLVTLTHGEFVRRTQRGHILPRRDAWRDYLRRRLSASTAFDRATGGFWRKRGAEAWQPLTEGQLISEVRQQVLAAPVPGTQAHSWCNDEWLAGMLRYLRRVLVGEVPFAVHSLRAFARGALVLSPGQDVIVTELYGAFTRYSRECSLPVMPPLVFQKMIAAVMRESPWHKPKSKSIRRDSKCQNGFRGLTLRSSFALLKP